MRHYDINIARNITEEVMFRFVTAFTKGIDSSCIYMHSWLPRAPPGMRRHHICTTPELKVDTAHMHPDNNRNMIQVHKNRVLFASYGYEEVSIDITSFFGSTCTDAPLSKEALDAFIPCTASFWIAVISTPYTSLLLAWKYVTTRKPFEIKIVTSDLRVFTYLDPKQTVQTW